MKESINNVNKRKEHNLNSLEFLDLSLNFGLSKLPDSLKKLKNIKTLKLGSTYITEFPDFIRSMKNLENLDLSWCWQWRKRNYDDDNDLDDYDDHDYLDIPVWIEELKELKTLNVEGVKLRPHFWQNISDSLKKIIKT